MLVKRKVLALTTVILAVTAAAALAATITGDGTLIGTSGADKLKAGQGDDTVFGLGGQDQITAGDGNDILDGDGACPPGVNPGDYPNGLPPGVYCAHVQLSGDPGDSITAGQGNDTVFGGGGQNGISVGGGNDTIYGGPIGDAINAGSGYNGSDQVYLGRGPNYAGSAVATGTGTNVVHAQNGAKDAISCAPGNNTTVYADKVDAVSKTCAHIIYTADPNPGPFPLPARERRSVRNARHIDKKSRVLAHEESVLARLVGHRLRY
jgi:Ca2+-binding RTX toxin-like protein